jgi:AcrR family transcriptional regulator
MHSVMDSAPESLRSRQLAETSRRLRAEARRLTAERGLGGFTVEEVCSEVGVSRRTFFNYFASKENAVLGIAARTDISDLDEAFLASREDVLDAVAELHIARWERMDMSPAEVPALVAAFTRAPQLVQHLLDIAAIGEREDAALVARREGWAEDDPRAAIAVQLITALIRPTVSEYFADTGEDFRTVMMRKLAIARAFFAA